MRAMPHLDTWLTRVQKIKSVLGITQLYGSKDSVSLKLNKKLSSVFDRFWLDQIDALKVGNDGIDYNKLRFYKTIKGSFTQEPYTKNIQNKSQRAWLKRYRVSAVPTLRLESGHYTWPVTPVA
jgi:hypothetical protein